MPQKIDALLAVTASQPVIPVLQIERIDLAGSLCRALAEGGLRAVEITLRTPDALDAIRIAVDEAPDAVIGAGTVLDARQFHRAVDAGARFIVSPGTTQELLDAARGSPVPLLPGAVTPSEIMAAREEGYSFLKFFPAEQSGGAAFLRALAAPLAGMRFCPTGGITPANARDYLALPNVACVGGSWVAPQDRVGAGDWETIRRLAREAAALA